MSQTKEEAAQLQARYVSDRQGYYAATGLPISRARGHSEGPHALEHRSKSFERSEENLP